MLLCHENRKVIKPPGKHPVHGATSPASIWPIFHKGNIALPRKSEWSSEMKTNVPLKTCKRMLTDFFLTTRSWKQQTYPSTVHR